MGIISRPFSKKMPVSEHAVIVNFSYGQIDLHPLFQLEGKLAEAISHARVGEYDGNDVATDGSNAILYMYGPNGDDLFEVVKPVLESSDFMRGATVIVRYGPPKSGVRERRVKLSS